MKWAEHMHMSDKKVGELNGPWAFLFKLSNILLPMVVAWCVWATSHIYSLELRQAKAEQWMNQGPRFTSVDADRLRLQILETVGQEATANQRQLIDELKLMRAEFVDLKVVLMSHIATESKKP